MILEQSQLEISMYLCLPFLVPYLQFYTSTRLIPLLQAFTFAVHFSEHSGNWPPKSKSCFGQGYLLEPLLSLTIWLKGKVSENRGLGSNQHIVTYNVRNSGHIFLSL